jgi:hypothetical protein
MVQKLNKIISYLIILVAIGGSAQSFGGTPLKEAECRNTMRRVMEAQITWTRLFIVSTLADLPDKALALERLHRNQSDIGTVMSQYYGRAAAGKLTALLEEHVVFVADFVTAAKLHDKTKQIDVMERWSVNADAIAIFLSGANPDNWSLATLKSMFREHRDLTVSEINARVNSNWAGDILAFEQVHDQMVRLSDLLSNGVILQFPRNFQ